MPVGFVPLHCFYISALSPVPDSFCDWEFGDKRLNYVALGQFVLITAPIVISH